MCKLINEAKLKHVYLGDRELSEKWQQMYYHPLLHWYKGLFRPQSVSLARNKAQPIWLLIWYFFYFHRTVAEGHPFLFPSVHTFTSSCGTRQTSLLEAVYLKTCFPIFPRCFKNIQRYIYIVHLREGGWRKAQFRSTIYVKLMCDDDAQKTVAQHFFLLNTRYHENVPFFTLQANTRVSSSSLR